MTLLIGYRHDCEKPLADLKVGVTVDFLPPSAISASQSAPRNPAFKI